MISGCRYFSTRMTASTASSVSAAFLTSIGSLAAAILAAVRAVLLELTTRSRSYEKLPLWSALLMATAAFTPSAAATTTN